MITTSGGQAATVETCPECGSLHIRVEEPAWFGLDLDRGADLRGAERDLEFSCRDCGARFS